VTLLFFPTTSPQHHHVLSAGFCWWRSSGAHHPEAPGLRLYPGHIAVEVGILSEELRGDQAEPGRSGSLLPR
jgi:hypothetical protein